MEIELFPVSRHVQLIIHQEKHKGLTAGATVTAAVNDVPPVRAEIDMGLTVVLQVTESRVPRLESGVMRIWLLAVVRVVLTTSVVAAAAMTLDPAERALHTAGDAVERQGVSVDH
jgi:hypothetical protein